MRTGRWREPTRGRIQRLVDVLYAGAAPPVRVWNLREESCGEQVQTCVGGDGKVDCQEDTLNLALRALAHALPDEDGIDALGLASRELLQERPRLSDGCGQELGPDEGAFRGRVQQAEERMAFGSEAASSTCVGSDGRCRYDLAADYLLAFLLGHELAHAYGHCVLEPERSLYEEFNAVGVVRRQVYGCLPTIPYVSRDEIQADLCALRTVAALDNARRIDDARASGALRRQAMDLVLAHLASALPRLYDLPAAVESESTPEWTRCVEAARARNRSEQCRARDLLETCLRTCWTRDVVAPDRARCDACDQWTAASLGRVGAHTFVQTHQVCEVDFARGVSPNFSVNPSAGFHMSSTRNPLIEIGDSSCGVARMLAASGRLDAYAPPDRLFLGLDLSGTARESQPPTADEIYEGVERLLHDGAHPIGHCDPRAMVAETTFGHAPRGMQEVGVEPRVFLLNTGVHVSERVALFLAHCASPFNEGSAESSFETCYRWPTTLGPPREDRCVSARQMDGCADLRSLHVRTRFRPIERAQRGQLFAPVRVLMLAAWFRRLDPQYTPANARIARDRSSCAREIRARGVCADVSLTAHAVRTA